METLELQLVTVELDNGDAGVFVGIPLVHERMSDADCQVCDIWFSDTQPVPLDMTLGQLLSLVQRQFCRCRGTRQ
ncbi:MAG TPA: hypothetical protein ENK53_04285 [Thiotrichales bacterium]|nr:hypothetical protein [Thiotrichales bacterium]